MDQFNTIIITCNYKFPFWLSVVVDFLHLKGTVTAVTGKRLFMNYVTWLGKGGG